MDKVSLGSGSTEQPIYIFFILFLGGYCMIHYETSQNLTYTGMSIYLKTRC